MAGELDGGTITGLMAAESQLARDEVKAAEAAAEALPEGHPLKELLKHEKGRAGDLTNLPPGHPVIKAILQAREAYEQNLTDDAPLEEGEVSDTEIRRATRIDQNKVKRDAREREETKATEGRSATGAVNDKIEVVLSAMNDLNETLNNERGTLVIDPRIRVKLARLDRLMPASYRGIAECRF